MATSIDDLAIVVSASTDQLAGDLRRAAGMVENFAKIVGRNAPDILGGASKASSIDFGAVKRNARMAAANAASEFGKSYKSIRESIALPTKAMIAGGTGVALADPFIAATAAAEVFAAAVEVPFKVAAAGSHMAAAVIGLPFKAAGLAVEGLSGTVGGMVPVVGGAIAGVGKVAGGVAQLTGHVLEGVASGMGTAFGVAGDVIGKLVGGTAKVAIQSLAVSFEHLKQSVNLAAEMEKTRISFEVLIGSATEANKVLGGLRKFAAETPFSQRDILGAGQQLAGYSVAADQLVPTIRMLGDVSAATNKPISELVYLYGTLLNQDRAYAVDIKQFATAGIPIYAELGKVLGVTKDRVREMVEEGKVGIPEVQRAFVNMTSAGGRFHGLMARQAESFAGLREQMTDAFDVAKMRLGETLIEELGLKQATKDVTAFVSSVGSQMDGIRPAIRFVGELGRGVANVGVEFGRTAAQFASINFQALGDAFPKQAEYVRGLLADLKNFKIDPMKTGAAVFDMAESIVTGFGAALQWVQTEGGKFKTMFETDFVNPAKEFAGVMKDVFDFLSLKHFDNGVQELHRMTTWGQEPAARPWEGRESPFRPEIFQKEYRDTLMSGPADQAARGFGLNLFTAGNNKDRFGPIQPGESAESASRRYRELDILIGMGRHLVNDRGMKQYTQDLDPLIELQKKNFLNPFVGPGRDAGAVSGEFWAGRMPERLAGQVAKEPGIEDDILRGVRTQRAAWLERMNGEQQAAAASKATRDAFFGLAGAAIDAKNALAAAAEQEKVRVDFKLLSPEAMTVGKKAREEYGVDPRQQIAKEFGYLKQSVAVGAINAVGSLGLLPGLRELEGGIDRSTYDRAVKGLGERAESITGPRALPDAAMAGTSESLRLINQWRSGMGSQTAEGLLQKILDAINAGNRNTDKAAEYLRPNYAPVNTPNWVV